MFASIRFDAFSCNGYHDVVSYYDKTSIVVTVTVDASRENAFTSL